MSDSDDSDFFNEKYIDSNQNISTYSILNTENEPDFPFSIFNTIDHIESDHNESEIIESDNIESDKIDSDSSSFSSSFFSSTDLIQSDTQLQNKDYVSNNLQLDETHGTKDTLSQIIQLSNQIKLLPSISLETKNVKRYSKVITREKEKLLNRGRWPYKPSQQIIDYDEFPIQPETNSHMSDEIDLYLKDDLIEIEEPVKDVIIVESDLKQDSNFDKSAYLFKRHLIKSSLDIKNDPNHALMLSNNILALLNRMLEVSKRNPKTRMNWIDVFKLVENDIPEQ